LGPFRFTLAAFERILLPRTYKGKVHFLPAYDKLNFTVKDNSPIWTNKYQLGGNQILPDDVVQQNSEDPLASKYDFNPAEGWVTIDGFFGLFLACNTTHIAADAYPAPMASFGEGLIDFIFSEGATDRFSLLSFMGKFGEGTHVTVPGVNYYKVKALILEPLDKGCISLDGERGNYSACKLESHKGILNLMG